MSHERRTDALPLVLVDHGESHFRRSWVHDHITRTARDRGPAVFLDDCDQRDVVDEVDVQEKIDFRFRKAAFLRKRSGGKWTRC